IATLFTSAPRCFKPAARSGLGTPYSCTAMRLPAIAAAPSSAASTSRQVLGSGTLSQGAKPNSFNTAAGLGPRADAGRENDDIEISRFELRQEIQRGAVFAQRHLAHGGR